MRSGRTWSVPGPGLGPVWNKVQNQPVWWLWTQSEVSETNFQQSFYCELNGTSCVPVQTQHRSKLQGSACLQPVVSLFTACWQPVSAHSSGCSGCFSACFFLLMRTERGSGSCLLRGKRVMWQIGRNMEGCLTLCGHHSSLSVQSEHVQPVITL